MNGFDNAVSIGCAYIYIYIYIEINNYSIYAINKQWLR